jgi:hypothetical protein
MCTWLIVTMPKRAGPCPRLLVEVFMSTATTSTVTPIVAVRDQISKAGKAAANMLAFVREGARLAAAHLDASVPIKERIDNVMLAYQADFAAVDHNVKALFKDLLTLHAAGQSPVTVDTGKGAIHTTAVEATKLAKHDMKKAATEVRAANGMGRASGGGRKAAQKPAQAAQAAEQAVGTAPDVKAAVDGFSQWLDALPDYLSDVVYHPRIVAVLVEQGYTLSKAAKGRKVQGTASK